MRRIARCLAVSVKRHERLLRDVQWCRLGTYFGSSLDSSSIALSNRSEPNSVAWPSLDAGQGSRRSDDPREVRWLCFVEMATRTHADVVIGALSGYAMVPM